MHHITVTAVRANVSVFDDCLMRDEIDRYGLAAAFYDSMASLTQTQGSLAHFLLSDRF